VLEAGAAPTDKAVPADELLYDSSPAKEAIMVYVSSFDGVHEKLSVP